MTRSVLFVCTANICRSPMAMGLLQSQVDARWVVQSAGVWAEPGYPAARNAQRVLKTRGIDLRAHRSRPITAALVADFNLILVMERNHKEALRAAFRQHADKIFLLTEMVGSRADIVDPIGGSMADYEETAAEIAAILTKGFEKIAALAARE